MYITRRYQDLAVCIHADIANNRGLYNYYAPWLENMMDKHELPDHVKWKNSLVLTDSEGRHIGCSGAVKNSLIYYNPLEYNTEEIYKSKVFHLQRDVRSKKSISLSPPEMSKSHGEILKRKCLPNHSTESKSEGDCKSKDVIADKVQLVYVAESADAYDCRVDPNISAISSSNNTAASNKDAMVVSDNDLQVVPSPLEYEDIESECTQVTGFNFDADKQNTVGTFPGNCTKEDQIERRESDMQGKNVTAVYVLETNINDSHCECGNVHNTNNKGNHSSIGNEVTRSQHIVKGGDGSYLTDNRTFQQESLPHDHRRSRFCVVL